MSYSLDGVDISTWGAYPYIERTKECIALSGVFDLPKRIGTTEYNWGTSIEPFVDKEDIQLDGRNLILSLVIKSENYNNQLEKLKSACIKCRKLGTPFGSFDVVLKDELDVEEYIALNMAIITIKFWQQNYTPVDITVKPTGGNSYTIDGYSFAEDFGIYVASRSGVKSLGKRIEISTTVPYKRSEYREISDMVLNCKMYSDSMIDLHKRISEFSALCISPGIRNVKLLDNERLKVYFKDGITAKLRTSHILEFDLKCKLLP